MGENEGLPEAQLWMFVPSTAVEGVGGGASLSVDIDGTNEKPVTVSYVR